MLEGLRPAAPRELFATWLRYVIPRGIPLPQDIWDIRHTAILTLLWVHVPTILVFGLLQGEPAVHTIGEAALVAAPATAAGRQWLCRRTRASLTSLGLLTASAILVHLSGGYIELHFHFFIMVGIITLYQDWVPFALAISYVAVHHGLFGTLSASSVYNHADAIAHPWKWAGIHAMFVLAASVVGMVNWRLNEIWRERADLILHAAGDAILVVDGSGRISDINPAAASTFGCAPGDAIGKHLENFLPDGAAGTGLHSLFYPSDGTSVSTHPFELTGRRTDGTEFPAEATVATISTEGTPLFTLFLRDITDRKAMESMKDEFLSMASHELKTPLAGIKAHTQLLLRRLSHGDVNPEGHRDGMREINERTDYVAGLVDELLDLSRLQTGHLELRPERVDLASLLTAVVNRERELHPNFSISLEGAEEPAAGDWDRARLEEVFTNLIENAVKYSPPGGPICVSLRRSPAAGHVEVSVEDHGIGVPAAEVPLLFKRYYRASNARRLGSGLGLGLYLSNAFVVRHCGWIEVDSDEGKGARFRVTLPLVPPETPGSNGASDPSSAGASLITAS